MTPRTCPLCSYTTPCENNPCGLRNDGKIRDHPEPQSQSVPGRMTFTVLERT